MHYNIFVKSVFCSILACLALSCNPKIDIDAPAGRVVSVSPADNGKINLTLICNSNINEFLKVNYTFVGADKIGVSGYFTKSDTLDFSWAPDSTELKLAFNGEKLHSFTTVLFDRADGVLFNVMARLTTPTDGVEINWGAIYGEKYAYTQSVALWNDTLTALNSGLPGQTAGTGENRYIRLGVAPDKYGKYGISVDWITGNLFEK